MCFSVKKLVLMYFLGIYYVTPTDLSIESNLSSVFNLIESTFKFALKTPHRLLAQLNYCDGPLSKTRK